MGTLKAGGWAALALMSVPVTAFYALLFRYMRNVPIMDDYHAVIEFALVMRQLPSVGSKLLWIMVAQHNDYKFILLHLFVAAQWAATGHVNFTSLILFGNFLQLGIVWLYWKHFCVDEVDLNRRLFLFLPVVFLLMQLNGVENLDWAITDMEKIPAVFFSFASLHYLLKDGRRGFSLACVTALLAYFSAANGFMVAPIGLVLLAPRRQWARAAVWSGILLAAAGIYAYRYQVFGVTLQGSRAPLIYKPVFYLSLLGSGIENMSRFPVKGGAIVLGAVLLGLFAHAAWKKYYLTNPFAFYSTLWCLLTCVLITQGRSLMGIILSLTGRYKLFSDLMMVFGYGYAVHCLDTAKVSVRRKHMLYAATLAVVVLFAASSDYFGKKFLANRQRRVAEGVNEFEADPVRNPPMIGLTDQPIPQAEPQHDRVVLNEAIATGVYRLPPKPQR